MRILQVNKFFYSRGGAETHFFDVIDLLTAHGHEVVPWSMKDPANAASDYEKYFIDPIDFQKRESWAREFKKVGHLLYSTEAAQKLDRFLTDVKIDIAHLHNVYHHFSPSIFAVFKKHRVPVVMTLHDYKLVSPNYRLFNRHGVCLCSRHHRYYEAVFKRCVDDSLPKSMVAALELSFHKLFQFYEKGVARFIAPSEFMRTLMIEWGEPAEKFVTLNNFLNPAWYASASLPAPLPRTGGYLLYMGRLSHEKGILSLISAVRPLTQVSLKIIGAGPLEDSIRTQIKNTPHIELMGHKEGAELARIVEGTRAVVIPSEWFENYPMSLIEAFAKGKPVIASAIGGIPEIVQEGVNGWMFPPGNARALRAIIERVWGYEDRVLQTAGRAAQAYVRGHNNPEVYYEKLMKVYDTALGKNFEGYASPT
ncbi:MAG: group 1 glycosyl transferase [Candidatus Magasanikbacteria bacterium GW2011_GWC2_45_8]|uniref:Group 1 glycosyl transferase n=1 Tax=Candidatus Magasanikbacteria bacterium GW2011_GWC2_45_8 TaxID=1619050 RepID=A0A0G1N101_9BACT|nr:MAG: group 1 glycosyl transferase [Candidatus Magasanikbacteria bacterium GW2011_GWC2_45_8]